MGLDSVELVMAWEEEFGIDISNREAETIETVGNAVDLIQAKLEEEISKSPEKTVFRAISKVTGKSAGEIRREKALKELFPKENRKQAWKELEEQLGDFAISNLRRPRWVTVTGWLLALAALGAGDELLPGFAWAVTTALFVAYFWFAATRFLKRSFPPDSRTVGDLIAILEKQRAVFLEHQGLDRNAVQEKVVQLTVEQLGVKPEQCIDDAKFVADLGCD